jgi:hypothetical protein
MKVFREMKYLLAVKLWLSFHALNGAYAQQNQEVFKEIPDSLQSVFGKTEWQISAPLLSSGMRFIAKTSEGSLYHLRLSYSRFVLGIEKWLMYYTVNLDVVHHLEFFNKRENVMLQTQGLAIAPFGAQLKYAGWNRIQPIARLLGGFIYFDDPFPDARGLHINFTYELTLGLDVQIYKKVKWFSGYTFFHHSNAELGRINPGMDTNMLVMGLQIGY